MSKKYNKFERVAIQNELNAMRELKSGIRSNRTQTEIDVVDLWKACIRYSNLKWSLLQAFQFQVIRQDSIKEDDVIKWLDQNQLKQSRSGFVEVVEEEIDCCIGALEAEMRRIFWVA